MSHKVFICYDSNDEEVSSDISNLLELNNIKTWIKSRDLGENDTVYDISNAIRDSECVILVYSEDAKKSNYVTTEIDIAFSSDIQILVFKIDDATIEGKLGFYLKDKPIIEAPNPKDKYMNLLIDVKGILNNDDGKVILDEKPVIPADNHVFICYDEKDEEYANAICHTLEQNRIKCWIKNRDFGVNDTVFNIKENLEISDAVVLIHSANSAKSNYVATDMDIAMANNIPIILYKIDKYTLTSKLKEYVADNRLDAYPDVNSELENLVKKTSEILKNPVKKPIVKKIPEVKKEVVEKKEPVKEVKAPEKKKSKGFFSKKVIAAIAVIIILLIVGVIALSSVEIENNDSSVEFEIDDKSSSHISSDVSSDVSSGVSITKYHLTDERNDDTYSWDYSYFVYGTLGSDMLNKNYKVNASFYDSTGKLLGSSLEEVDQLEKVGNEYMLGHCFINSNDVKKITVNIYDGNTLIAWEDYEIID